MKALTLTFALLICTGAALAQTPDWMTPSEETVCDGETGAAYGLCNAYCEAMDCESEAPQASEAACTKVRDKFMNITGNDLPCEESVGSNCCVEHAGPGCGDPSCQAAVCDVAPSCCTDIWSAGGCASLAFYYCGGLCQ